MVKNMRILQINNYHYIKGGSEKVFLDTVKLLEYNGHEVITFSTLDDKNIPRDKSICIKVENIFSDKSLFSKLLSYKAFLYNVKVAKRLQETIDLYKPEIAHLHIYYGKLSNSVIDILHKNKIPFVISLHEYRLLCPNYTFLRHDSTICESCAKKIFKNDCIKYKCNKGNYLYSFLSVIETLYRDILYNPIKKANGFIAVSKFIRDKHLEYIPSIKNKIEHIYNFVDIKELTIYRKNITNKDDYYLYFGRLSYEKCLITLLNAFKERPSLKLLIVGTGPLDEEISKIVNEQKLNVKLIGFKTGSELYEIVSSARYTIVPSEWYENNPITILESLSLGTPIIASKIGGIPELVSDSFNGFIFENGRVESLIQALDKSKNYMKYYELVDNSIKFAEFNFIDDVHYNKLVNFYNKIIK